MFAVLSLFMMNWGAILSMSLVGIKTAILLLWGGLLAGKVRGGEEHSSKTAQ